MGRPRGPQKTALTAYLPNVLLARVKTYCRQNDISMTDLIESLLRAKLDGPEKFVPLPLPSSQPAKPTAHDLAARFGITTAAQLPDNGSAAAEQRSAEPIQVGDCPVEDVPRQDWVKLYRDLQEMEPSEALYTFRTATEGVKLPAGFLKMPMTRQLAWLQVNA